MEMIKYLITSDYAYYDDFAFSDVCIVDSKERAEELIVEFENNIQILKNTQGFMVFITNDDETFTNTLDKHEIIYLGGRDNEVKIFLKDGSYENLEETLKELNLYYEPSDHYSFILGFNDHDTLIKKYCNHEEAKLRIKEIEYIV